MIKAGKPEQQAADPSGHGRTGVKINSIITPANMKITPNIAAVAPPVEPASQPVAEPEPVVPTAAEQSLARAPQRDVKRGVSAGKLALVAVALLGLIGVLMIPQLQSEPTETVALTTPPSPAPVTTPEAVQIAPAVVIPKPERVAPKPVVVVATRPKPRPERTPPKVVAEAPVIEPEVAVEPVVEVVVAPKPEPEPEIVVATPEPVAPAPKPEPVVVEEVIPVKHDPPATEQAAPQWQDGFVQQVTSGTLQALRGKPSNASDAVRADVAPAFAILQAALDGGQSGAEIERTMNNAHQTSAIRLPSHMLQQNGQVDMAKLLEAFAAK